MPVAQMFKENQFIQMIGTLAFILTSFLVLVNFTDTADGWITTEAETRAMMEMHVTDSHVQMIVFKQTQDCRWYTQNIKSLDNEIYRLNKETPKDVPRVNNLVSQKNDYQKEYSDGECWKKEYK